LDGLWRRGSTVGCDSNLDRKEREMNKFFSIALGVVAVALAAVAPAAADPPMTAQERGELATFQSGQQGPGQQIIAQEKGRIRDSRLFYPAAGQPVQVVGDPDRFDLQDAAVGGAATGALVLLAAAGLAFGRTRAKRTVSATT
jgi:hypothetical protein